MSHAVSQSAVCLSDKELLASLVKALVELPEEVRVEEQLMGGTGTSHLVIYAAPRDRGKIIGKSGRTVDAMRILFASIASLEDRRVFIEVYEPKRRRTKTTPK